MNTGLQPELSKAIDRATLNILLVEDDKHDVVAVSRALTGSQPAFQITTCVRAEEARSLLEDRDAVFDVVVSDLLLPGMSGLEFCLNMAKGERDHAIVILTGHGSEDKAVQALKAGVEDYLVKDSAGHYLQMLPVVISQAARTCRERLAHRQVEADRERLIDELKEALNQVRTLRGIIPICSSCKDIRDDKGYWHRMEAYLSENTEANFSHGLCVKCIGTLYPENADKILDDLGRQDND